MNTKLKISLSLAAMATLAACGGGPVQRVEPVTAAPSAVVVVPQAAVVTPPMYPAGVLVQTTTVLRSGYGRVDAITPLVDYSGSFSGARRLTLRMDDGSVQVVDTRGPQVAVGERVEITPESYIRYPVALR